MAPRIALIHCAIRGYTQCTIDFSRGFWYGTLPCPLTFEGAELLAASTSAVECYKSHAHTSSLSEVIQILYVPTQREGGIAMIDLYCSAVAVSSISSGAVVLLQDEEYDFEIPDEYLNVR